jgi:hypothetical protein
MSRGSRALLEDVESALRDTRKSVRSARTKVAKELEQVQRAATSKKPASGRRTATRSTARKTPARSTARKTTTRSTARRKAAKK